MSLPMLAFTSLLALTLAVDAGAQSQSDLIDQAANGPVQSDTPQSADGTAPINYTVPGGSQAVAHQTILRRRIQQAQQRQCVKIGCLVIVNETTGYDVVGLYLETANVGGASRWTPNQFRAPLRPMSAMYTAKAGDDAMCQQPVRFELVERTTKDRLEVRTTAAMCRKDAASSLLRIRVKAPDARVLVPNVTVDAPQ